MTTESVDGSGTRTERFDLVVAADGSASRLRVQAGLQRRSHEYAYGALWTVGHTSSVRGELRQVVQGTHDLIGLLALGKGRCNFFCSQNIADYDRVRLGGFDAWRDRIVSLCPEAAEVISHLDGFDGLALTRYNHVSLTGLTRGRGWSSSATPATP